jgi:uncharacterized Zn finger protein
MKSVNGRNTKKTDVDLVRVLTKPRLRQLGGSRSFERGEAYFRRGKVGKIAVYKGVATAPVQGAEKYAVKLWTEQEALRYDCTCPMGQGGSFCKHCVAVGLAWLDKPSSAKRKDRPLTMDDVQAYLSEQSNESLVGMLMDLTLNDENLRNRLFTQVATHRARVKGGKANTRPFLDAIDNAVSAYGFVGYHEVPGYARGIDDAVDVIEDLLKDGHAGEAVEVLEHAIRQVHDALGRVDDSDGCVSGVLCRIGALHLSACKKAHPEPMSLAQRLLDFELNLGYSDFLSSVADYATVLGTEGLAAYREQAEALWAQVPQLDPGEDRRSFATRFAITSIMRTLAEMSGDLNEWIAVESRDLSHAYSFLQIAEKCKKLRKHDLALDWAEKGLKAFPDRTDSRLREFLAEEYHRRKRHDEAMALIWKEFSESPRLDTYQNLQKHAVRISDWPAWREQALAYAREHVSKTKQSKQRYSWERNAGHSLLVQIFLFEKDVESAWREAQQGGCTNALWLELAKQRSIDHPEDALPIYQQQIEPTLAAKNNSAYDAAVAYLRIIRDLMNRMGKDNEFVAYLASIRAAHKPKRNFMKLLDAFK